MPIDLLAVKSSTPHFEMLQEALAFANAHEIPSHFTFHGGPILEGTRYLIQRSDAAATDSQALQRTLAGLGLAVQALHPVVDLSFFDRPLTWQERRELARLKVRHGFDGKRVILHPSRVARRKGQEDTILAAKEPRIRYPRLAGRATFVILGPVRDPGENDRLSTLVNDDHLDVAFVEEQTLDQLRLWFHAADVVLYPTRAEEPFGLVPVEAQACGRPVIVTDAGGLPETLNNGRSGLVVKKQDPAALADAIASILGDAKTRFEMGRQAREYIRTRYPLERTSAELTQSYLAAVQSRRERGRLRSLHLPLLPDEPLRVLSDAYGGVHSPGDILPMPNVPVSAETVRPGCGGEQSTGRQRADSNVERALDYRP